MPFAGWETSLGEYTADLFNVSPVRGVDKILSACCWLIPNRFAGQEIAAEACQALLGVMRVCYDNITQVDSNKSGFSWVMVMKLIRQVEVLYEMRATHLELSGTCSKYSPIAALELMKLFVRLFFLNSSQYHLTTTLNSSSYETCSKDSYHVARAFQSLSESKQLIAQNSWHPTCEHWNGEIDTTRCLTAANADTAFLNISRHHGSNIPDYNDVELSKKLCSMPWWDNKHSTALPYPLNQPYDNDDDQDPDEEMEKSSIADNSSFSCKMGKMMLLIGEMLYLVRPMICVFALRRFGSRSWKPWLLSLGIDLCSRLLLSKGENILKYAGVNRLKNSSIQDQLLNYLTMVRNFQWTPVEQKEMKRRKALFLIYLLRSPLFDMVTKPGLDSAQSLASTIPILGKVLGKAMELLYGAQRYYVYTSGSW